MVSDVELCEFAASLLEDEFPSFAESYRQVASRLVYVDELLEFLDGVPDREEA